MSVTKPAEKYVVRIREEKRNIYIFRRVKYGYLSGAHAEMLTVFKHCDKKPRLLPLLNETPKLSRSKRYIAGSSIVFVERWEVSKEKGDSTNSEKRKK